MKSKIAILAILLVTSNLVAAVELKCHYTETNSTGTLLNGHFINVGDIELITGLTIPSTTNSNVKSFIDTSNGKFTVGISHKPLNGTETSMIKSVDNLLANQEISSDLQVEEINYKLTCTLL